MLTLLGAGQGQNGVKYLLDIYTGASAAYSLRKLSSTTTNVVRVRRSSDNAEQNFTATQITDGTLTSFCGVGNGFVTTWYDQSGNNRNALQTSAANQPQIINSGSLILVNGKSSINFAGSINGNSLDLNLIQVGSVFGVNKIDTFPISGINYFLFRKSPGNGFYLGGGVVSNNYGVVDGTTRNSGVVSNLNQNLTCFNYNSNYFFSINGGTFTSISGANTVISIDTISRMLSSSLPLNGKSQEIIIYPTSQSTNKEGIETNINSYYNIY